MIRVQQRGSATVRRTLATILDLIYPRACAGCGQAGHGLWCDACASTVTPLRGNDAWREVDLAPAPPLRVCSCARYAPPAREAVHAFKFGDTPHLADVMAGWLAALWREQDLNPDVIVAVPLHPSRERERGYNQSDWLAQRLAKAVGCDYAPRALRRTRQTEQQATLSSLQRAHNVAGAFSANRLVLESRRVLIIDDVFTTGATLAACAIACSQAGAAEATAMTVTRAE